MSKKLLEIEELQDILIRKNNVKKNVNAYQENSDWYTFQTAMKILSPQSYGVQFQKRIIKAFGWTKNPEQERNGDVFYFIDDEKINSEIKVSVVSEEKKNVNIVQIRPNHKMDYYDIFIIYENGSVQRFRLSKEQMKNELELTGSNLAHGTKAGKDSEHENAEYRIDFLPNKNNKTFERWLKNYLIKDGAETLTNYVPNAIIDSNSTKENNEQ